MENLLKRIRINSVIAALLCILTGVIFIIFRQGVADLIARIIGALLTAGGALFIITYILKKVKTAYDLSGMVLGIVMVIIGIAILSSPRWFEQLFALILGLAILVSGVESVINAVRLVREDDSSYRFMAIALALITVILGLVLIVRRDAFSPTLIMVSGIFLIYDGVSSLLITGRLARIARTIKKGVQDTVQELSAIDAEAVEVDRK